MSTRGRVLGPLRPGLRRVMFQVHLWSGIGLSLYILAICVSGSASVFRRDLDKFLCPTTLTVPVQGQRLTSAQLQAKAHAAYPRFDPSRIEVGTARAADAPVEIQFFGEGTRLERLFDPYSGADLADSTACEPRFVTTLVDFHDNLGGGREGLRINGLGAITVLLICLSGAIVWWPRTGHWWRAMTVRKSTTWQRLVRDLHGAIGFWLMLFVLLWVVTGIYFAFPEPVNALSDVIAAAGGSSAALDDAVAWVVRLHFGRAFGYGAEVVWALFGLLPTVLVVTGILTWWHRVRPRGHSQ